MASSASASLQEAVFEFRDMLGYIDVADPPVYDTSVLDLTWTGTGWQLVSNGS